MSYSYGLDAELDAKRKEKYDPAREADAKAWIVEVIGEPFPAEDFQECLKNGQILCKLASKLTSKFQLLTQHRQSGQVQQFNHGFQTDGEYQ
jgi:hypothetical protein